MTSNMRPLLWPPMRSSHSAYDTEPSTRRSLRHDSSSLFSVFVLLPILLFAFGRTRDAKSARTAEAESVGLEELQASEQPEEQHNFGLVLPKTKHTHRFSVPNTTDEIWTVKTIHVNCTCTVAEAAKNFIEAGGATDFTIAYQAGGHSGDDRRSVIIEFEEANVPPIKLAVFARIRAPLTVSNSKLVFNAVGLGNEMEKRLKITNFSPSEWESLTCESSADWLTVTTGLVEQIEKLEPEARQAWQARVKVQTEGLRPGKHDAEIRIDPRCADVEPSVVAVELTVISPVRAIPSELFFGTAKVGQQVHSSVSVLLSSDLESLDLTEATTKHEMGDSLRVELKQASVRRWEVRATLMPQQVGMMDDAITIADPASRFPDLVIPVVSYVTAE